MFDLVLGKSGMKSNVRLASRGSQKNEDMPVKATVAMEIFNGP